MFSGGNNILGTLLVEVHHIECAYLVVRGHFLFVVRHLGQVARAVVERLYIGSHLITESLYEVLRKFIEPARPFFEHEVAHFYTYGEYFRVHTHIHLPSKFLTKTPTQFFKPLSILIIHPLALGLLLLLLGLLGAFFLLRFLYVVVQLGFALFVEFTHKALYIDFLRLWGRRFAFWYFHILPIRNLIQDWC